MPQRFSLLTALLWLVACAGPSADQAAAPTAEGTPPTAPVTERAAWALAIHGGAGTIPRDTPADRVAAYEAALSNALAAGRDALAAGEPSLDVVEKVVRMLEDAPEFNAGKGAVFTNAGTNELDAAIMDGATLAAGAVSGLETVKNPVSLARLVMTETRHVFLVGDGAEQFATETGVERVEPEYFFTQRRYDAWQKANAAEQVVGADGYYGTVGAVALDRDGNLAAATSTGGMTNKRFGRVGDVPIIGAGTYANNVSCAVSGTGFGEQFIRHTVARDIAARMTWGGASLQAAAEAVIHGELNPGDGGVIAVSKDGDIALVFNSVGMFRGAAHADGRFDVAIWGDDD